VVYDVNAMAVRQSVTPNQQLGRVNSSFLLLSEGLHPAGALLAGVVATALGVQTALFIGATGMCFAVLWLISSPVPAMRDVGGEAVLPQDRRRLLSHVCPPLTPVLQIAGALYLGLKSRHCGSSTSA
jgi:hypothetical protein